jgi:hypothetical protein
MNFKDRRLAVRVEDHPLEYPRFPVGSRMGTRKLGQWSSGIEVFFLSGGADQRSC